VGDGALASHAGELHEIYGAVKRNKRINFFYYVHGSPNPKARGTGALWKSRDVTSTALGPSIDLGEQS